MQSRPELRCPRCGTSVEPLQEYCLQCGVRLPGGGRLATVLVSTWRRLIPWYPGDWIWPVLALAFLTAGSTAVALGAQSERRAAAPVLIATGSHVTVSIGTTTTPLPTTTAVATTAPPTTETVPQPTISTGTLPIAPGSPSNPVTTTAPPTTTTTPSSSGVQSWPRGTSGWTNVLESLPESQGRAAAVARARGAQRQGVPNVGVLLSSEYSSLHSGYWVVYAGVYATQAQAQAGLQTARSHGFAGAYPAHVAP